MSLKKRLNALKAKATKRGNVYLWDCPENDEAIANAQRRGLRVVRICWEGDREEHPLSYPLRQAMERCDWEGDGTGHE